METIERLAMHLAFAVKLLQQGTPLASLQTELLTLRGAIKDVLALTEPEHVQLHTIMPESIAELLAEDVVIPDDPRDLENDV